MFHIEVDRILLEIGAGKSELYNLEFHLIELSVLEVLYLSL